MSALGIPVPPGLTITTEVRTEYNTQGKDKIIEILKRVEAAIVS
jgi:pyruvate,orthophosphate dikinase